VSESNQHEAGSGPEAPRRQPRHYARRERIPDRSQVQSMYVLASVYNGSTAGVLGSPFVEINLNVSSARRLTLSCKKVGYSLATWPTTSASPTSLTPEALPLPRASAERLSAVWHRGPVQCRHAV
jgi:hypothetical protein